MDIQDKPLVSILIPTFNRAELLKKALESAINQTYKNIEIIIGDNHSEDNTEDVCKQYASIDKRIKYYRHNENIKLAGNGNFLVNKISGEYFIWLNDDDWLSLDYVEKCIQFLANNNDYSFVSPSSIFYYDHFSFKSQGFEPIINQDDVAERMKSFLETIGISVLVNGMFKTSIINKWKKLESNIFKQKYAEDCIFMLAYLAAGKGMCINSTHYNKQDTGATRISIENTPEDYWDTTNINNITQHYYCSKIFSDAIKNDAIFKEFLSEEETQKCSNVIIDLFYKNYINNKLKNMKRGIKHYIKRHPLFFTRKRFYFKVNRFKFEKRKYLQRLKELNTK